MKAAVWVVTVREVVRLWLQVYISSFRAGNRRKV